MAATLALIAALFFALAATLEQKGTLDLPTIGVAMPEAGRPAEPMPARKTA